MPPAPPNRLVRLSLLFYLPMIASGVFARPPAHLAVAEPARLLAGLGVALGAGLVVVAGSRLTARRTAWGRRLHAEFHGVLGGVESRQILLLALLSAFGEELLFRGVLHPRLGLVPAALLFAALHFPVRRALLPWTGFAFVLGLVLGGLTDAFRSLWPAIFLHFFINYCNLHFLVHGPPPEPPRPPGTDAPD